MASVAVNWTWARRTLALLMVSPLLPKHGIAGFITSVTWIASYLSFAANACGAAVNLILPLQWKARDFAFGARVRPRITGLAPRHVRFNLLRLLGWLTLIHLLMPPRNVNIPNTGCVAPSFRRVRKKICVGNVHIVRLFLRLMATKRLAKLVTNTIRLHMQANTRLAVWSQSCHCSNCRLMLMWGGSALCATLVWLWMRKNPCPMQSWSRCGQNTADLFILMYRWNNGDNLLCPRLVPCSTNSKGALPCWIARLRSASSLLRTLTLLSSSSSYGLSWLMARQSARKLVSEMLGVAVNVADAS